MTTMAMNMVIAPACQTRIVDSAQVSLTERASRMAATSFKRGDMLWSPVLSTSGCYLNSSLRRSQKRLSCSASFSQQGLAPELKEAIDDFVVSHKVILFMKGTKLFPQCGFSNTCVQILNTMSVPYETVNILEDDRLRQGMKEYSNWPTFPQLYIDGEFFGGCDITIEAFQNGDLKEVIEKAMLS